MYSGGGWRDSETNGSMILGFGSKFRQSPRLPKGFLNPPLAEIRSHVSQWAAKS
jgi:hypothetical protein